MINAVVNWDEQLLPQLHARTHMHDSAGLAAAPHEHCSNSLKILLEDVFLAFIFPGAALLFSCVLARGLDSTGALRVFLPIGTEHFWLVVGSRSPTCILVGRLATRPTAGVSGKKATLGGVRLGCRWGGLLTLNGVEVGQHD